jgi:hypothetical protein
VSPDVVVVLSMSSPVETVARAVALSPFVFTGRIRALDSTTTSSLGPGHHSIVMDVRADSDTVFIAPRGMRDLRRRTVTVVAGDIGESTAGLRPGRALVLFAYGLASDSGLLLRAVARMQDVRGDRDRLRQKIDSAREFVLDQQVRGALQRSDLVILGTVTAEDTVAIPDSLAALARSGHVPRWRQARVTVVRAFKPAAPPVSPMLRVLYPGTADMAFAAAPRPEVGHAYVFLLRAATRLSERNRIGIDPLKFYFVLDALDVRPEADTTRVRRVLP